MNFITCAKGLLVIIAIIIITALVYDYSMSKAALEAKKAELLVMSDKIKKQNEAIDSLKLDITKYKEQKPKIVEKIVTKYEHIQVSDKTCEAYLEAIHKSQLEFFNRKDSK